MTIDAQIGRIDWAPDAIGSHAVRVSDGLLWTELPWTLQVKTNVQPTAAIEPATALLSPNEPHAIRIVPSGAAKIAVLKSSPYHMHVYRWNGKVM